MSYYFEMVLVRTEAFDEQSQRLVRIYTYGSDELYTATAWKWNFFVDYRRVHFKKQL